MKKPAHARSMDGLGCYVMEGDLFAIDQKVKPPKHDQDIHKENNS